MVVTDGGWEAIPGGWEAIPGGWEAIPELDGVAMAAAEARQARLTKPAGSLGRLETLATQLAGMQGTIDIATRPRAIVVLAADHGIAAQGVSAYPQAVTAQMVANYLRGGAAINVLSRGLEAELIIVDVGVAQPIPAIAGAAATLRSARIRNGTNDFSREPAMVRTEALAAIEVGRRLAAEQAAAGCRVLAIGEMGIANTAAASALTAVLTGASIRAVTGRGSGIDDPAFERKVRLLETAVTHHAPDPSDPIGVLATVGGFEIGGLVGLILGAAARRIPVVLDGFITGAAALVAARACPGVVPWLIASHRSAEPGHAIILESLGLAPLLELELRLGEGTGAALAVPILDAAGRLLAEMATFDSAGMTG